MTIQILPEILIAQIAAGEVVERPASVIKELLENALDAEATSIHVAVKGGGRGLIRISDNGSGIRADEAEVAFVRHATSKLRTVEDLERIMTLGFRGEALSSIAAVSQLNITTRHRDETTGTQLRIEGGVVVHRQAVGAPAGTVISVENLFYNTPARLKFLKAESTEKRHITHLLTRYAMAYPQVRFTLEQDGREMLRTSGSGELADVVVQVLGLESFKQMLPVEVQSLEVPKVTVWGYTSEPSLYRADRNQISLFVNGRWVSDSKLSYAVVQAYHGVLREARYPVTVLMVALPPNEVDVNVHPTKAEVRFRDANAVFATVQRGVRTAIISAGGRVESSPIHADADYNKGGWGREQIRQPEMGLIVEDDGRLPQSYRKDYPETETAIPEGIGRPVRPRTLPLLRVVGQVGATYIIAEGPAGLYLIDQHAAHHRVLYEALLEGDFDVMALETPQAVDLAPKQAKLLEKHLTTFTDCGFDIALFGTNTFQIRAIPQMLSRAELRDVLRVIVEDFGQRDAVEAVRLRVSQYGAAKSGQVLNQEDMQGIIRRLERAREPLKDPFDRPTLLHMTGDQLARQFGR